MSDCTAFQIKKYTCDQEVRTYKSWLVPENDYATQEEQDAAKKKVEDLKSSWYAPYGFSKADLACTITSWETLQKKNDPGLDQPSETDACTPDEVCAGWKPGYETGDVTTLKGTEKGTPIRTPLEEVPGATFTRTFKYTHKWPDIDRIKKAGMDAIAEYQKIVNDPTGIEALKRVGLYPCMRPNSVCNSVKARVKRGAQNSINRIKPYLDQRAYKDLAQILNISPYKSNLLSGSTTGTVKAFRTKETTTEIKTWETSWYCEVNDTEECCECSSSSSSSTSSSSSGESSCVPVNKNSAACVNSVQANHPECCQNWTSACDTLYCDCVEGRGIVDDPGCSPSTTSSINLPSLLNLIN
jgi:hypothetical protein